MLMKHVAQPQPYGPGEELVVFQGLLYDDQRFEVLPSYSTRIVSEWPRVTGEGYFIEIQDGQGESLGREPVAVNEAIVCNEVASRHRHVHGCITLRPAATRLLFYKEDVLVGQFPIGEPPSLELKWKHQTVSRGKPYKLGLKFSKPAPDAYLQVIYQWTDRLYRTISIIDPAPQFQLDFSQLPGGKDCRLVVTYTSGMRTVVATTNSFSVAPLAASLHIVRPRQNAEFAPWHPITLEAEIIDQQNSPEYGDLVWLLNGKEVGKGRFGCLETPPEGKYELEARLHGKESITARREFEVSRPEKVMNILANDWDRESGSPGIG